jgi:uncharacterized membrane protein (DUF106 family)
MGESLGKFKLPDFFVGNEHVVVLVFGIVVTVVSILIPKVELYDEADLSKLPDEARPDKK